jgi:hippurate hydrolase
MLAGAARLLATRAESLSGTVLLMFQPGEEGYHGARFMLDDGLIAPARCRLALHVMPNAPHGQVAGRAGALMAAADQIDIVVKGAGATPRCRMMPPIRCRWPARSSPRSRPW